MKTGWSYNAGILWSRNGRQLIVPFVNNDNVGACRLSISSFWDLSQSISLEDLLGGLVKCNVQQNANGLLGRC